MTEIDIASRPLPIRKRSIANWWWLGAYTVLAHVAAMPASGQIDSLLVKPTISLVKLAEGAPTQPGALLKYSLLITNYGTAPAVDVVVVDPVPAQLLFAVNSPATTLPPGVNGVVEYSSDNAASWIYLPVPAGCGAPAGYDACVTHLRWRLLTPLPNDVGQNAGTATFSARVK